MDNPFDDPQFAAEMARRGVTHKPGMAAALMAQLAPLLADEGIDLDNLEASDLDGLNAALARAMDRHNFELFSPSTAHREAALAVLRRVAEAVGVGDSDRVDEVLGAVEPEPRGDQPAISHVIGVGLGRLDTWLGDGGEASRIGVIRLPAVERAVRSAATDIIALARSGRAFDSLDGLHRKQNGLVVFRATALAVAAVVGAWAERDGMPVAELCSRVLVDGGTGGSGASRASGALGVSGGSGSSGFSGAAFRRPAGSGQELLLRRFRKWAETAPSIIAPTVDEEVSVLGRLFEVGRRGGLDLGNPDDAEALIDKLREDAEDDDEDFTYNLLAVIDDYVHFRLSTGHDDAWAEVHDVVEDALLSLEPEPDSIRAALDAASLLSSDEISAALSATPLVAAVPALLEWIGTSRPVTGTGGLRRADIAFAASLLGITAVGVNRMPRGTDREPGVTYAMSIDEVPVLAAWWYALQAADVIEVGATRVRAGRAASAGLSADVGARVVGAFVTDVVLPSYGGGVLAPAMLTHTLHAVLSALSPEIELEPLDEQGAGPHTRLLADIAGDHAEGVLAVFARMGLVVGVPGGSGVSGVSARGVVQDLRGSVFVPEGLRGAVAQGVAWALTAAAVDGGAGEAS